RYLRIKERMEAKPKFTIDDFKSIQHDNVSLPGRALAGYARKLDIKEPELRPFVELLANWNGELSRETPAGPLYAIWLRELLEASFTPHVPPVLLEFVRTRHGTETLLEALDKPDAFWFGKDPQAGRDALLRSTFILAVSKTKQLVGSDPKQWAWGKLHQ